MPWIQVVSGRRTAWLVALLPLVLAARRHPPRRRGRACRPPPPTRCRRASTAPRGPRCATQLPEDQGSTAVLLWTVDTGTLDDDGPRGPRPGSPPTSARSSVARTAPSPSPRTAPRRSRWSRSRGPSSEEVSSTVSDLRRDLDASAPDGVEAQVTGPAAVPRRPLRGLRRRQHPPAHRDRGDRRGPAHRHLPQSGPLAGPTDGGRGRRPVRRRRSPPRPCRRSGSPGTPRRSGSCPCSSSAPARTTRCC